jgi:hypothetical protein
MALDGILTMVIGIYQIIIDKNESELLAASAVAMQLTVVIAWT